MPYAQRVKAEVGLPTLAVGLITEPQQAESILANDEADAVSLARAMLYDPRWPWHAAAELGAQVSAPKQYWRSQPREFRTCSSAPASASAERPPLPLRDLPDLPRPSTEPALLFVFHLLDKPGAAELRLSVRPEHRAYPPPPPSASPSLVRCCPTMAPPWSAACW